MHIFTTTTMADTMKMTCLIFYICLLALQQDIVMGFMCYSCSYDIRRKEDWNRPECRNNSDSLGKIGLIKCDDDKFCTIQEVLDKGEKRITNYDRSCSATSLGNKCTEDFLRVICVNSCQGDYCNGQEVVDELKPYLTDSANNLHIWNNWCIVLLSFVVFCVFKMTCIS